MVGDNKTLQLCRNKSIPDPSWALAKTKKKINCILGLHFRMGGYIVTHRPDNTAEHSAKTKDRSTNCSDERRRDQTQNCEELPWIISPQNKGFGAVPAVHPMLGLIVTGYQ